MSPYTTPGTRLSCSFSRSSDAPLCFTPGTRLSCSFSRSSDALLRFTPGTRLSCSFSRSSDALLRFPPGTWLSCSFSRSSSACSDARLRARPRRARRLEKAERRGVGPEPEPRRAGFSFRLTPAHNAHTQGQELTGDSTRQAAPTREAAACEASSETGRLPRSGPITSHFAAHQPQAGRAVGVIVASCSPGMSYHCGEPGTMWRVCVVMGSVMLGPRRGLLPIEAMRCVRRFDR